VAGRVPANAILRGLFDLSAAETKLAAALASGQTLKAAAASRFISMPTARSQLAQIFHKTGTHQQSELVALLKSAYPAVGGDEA
jgi:DNA-binding CsgD family transcriptional regulator